MDGDAADPLLLGQRVLAILETGLRTATYKLATLMALIDHCIENMPERTDDVLRVPIPDLAHRVLELYWPQVRPFEGHELRQSTQPRARILVATTALREATEVTGTGLPVDIAGLRAPAAYQSAVDEIALCLAQQPLHRLQKLPGSSASDPFLYDDSFLHDQVPRSTLHARGDAIELKPGVAQGLARLAGLLKLALEIMWVDDVRRMNRFLHSQVPDVAGHLFGRERTALAAVREPFKEAFGPHCFYCGTHLPVNNPVDHVLPWSLVGIDGLANLVLACARCNGDKGGALPAVSMVDRVLERDRNVLDEIASEIQWPTQHERVVAAARGIYRGQPAGVPTWSGYKQSERLDISFLPAWGSDSHRPAHTFMVPRPLSSSGREATLNCKRCGLDPVWWTQGQAACAV
ncbi:HNH endonuclease [Mycobacterium xenopi]|uniref:HNH endonuclease n=1 Tax=Mycobacterium xenopi TaxID=1789 RepID=A0AAD1M3C0_MYCXE|nr:HNH endonuclease [Mycobacterium xenopi]MDA3640395.1 HNH endonuclease [Mycobacterium xenopi]MDA3664899.1 HNH endonuclease [Mycobacterium xenopi]BBU24291.1 HNH endonuclease [Mycobacterium xenopi]SPX90405.1 HNH nuclease [Mycobacterium xenopi]